MSSAAGELKLRIKGLAPGSFVNGLLGDCETAFRSSFQEGNDMAAEAGEDIVSSSPAPSEEGLRLRAPEAESGLGIKESSRSNLRTGRREKSVRASKSLSRAFSTHLYAVPKPPLPTTALRALVGVPARMYRRRPEASPVEEALTEKTRSIGGRGSDKESTTGSGGAGTAVGGRGDILTSSTRKGAAGDPMKAMAGW